MRCQVDVKSCFMRSFPWFGIKSKGHLLAYNRMQRLQFIIRELHDNLFNFTAFTQIGCQIGFLGKICLDLELFCPAARHKNKTDNLDHYNRKNQESKKNSQG